MISGAAAGKGIGLFALVEGVLFVAILFLGLVYVWAKGDLDWVLSYSGPRYQPKTVGRRVHVAKVAEIEADMAEQLARVREMERNGELEPIPEFPTAEN